jgi:hypothetical protein
MADPSYVDSDGVLTDGEAWVAIQSKVAATTEATVTFTSTDDGQVGDFSQYMDLCVVVYCQQADDSTEGLIYLVLNGQATGGLYNTQWMRVQGTTANATQYSNSNRAYGIYSPARKSSPDQTYLFGASIWDFYDVNSGKANMFSVKSSCNCRDATVSAGLMRVGGFAKTSAPLTSIQFYRASTGFSAGSRFDLFGILPRMVAP